MLKDESAGIEDPLVRGHGVLAENSEQSWESMQYLDRCFHAREKTDATEHSTTMVKSAWCVHVAT
jgi:hypothetical protein